MLIKNLLNIDYVIHLATLSNDPDKNPKITYDINYKATVKLAKLQKTQVLKNLSLSLLKVFVEFQKDTL